MLVPAAQSRTGMLHQIRETNFSYKVIKWALGARTALRGTRSGIGHSLLMMSSAPWRAAFRTGPRAS